MNFSVREIKFFENKEFGKGEKGKLEKISLMRRLESLNNSHNRLSYLACTIYDKENHNELILMTNPADNFRKKMQAKEQASQEHLVELQKQRDNTLKAQQQKVEIYLEHLPQVIEKIKEWSELGGLQSRPSSVSYYDYDTLYQAKGLMVSDGNKKIFFHPDGVSRTLAFKGIVQIEMPTPLGFHQYYLGLDSNSIEEKPFWVFVDYDRQNPSVWQPVKLTEDLFFQLMTEAFM